MLPFIGSGAQTEELKCEVERRKLKSVMFRPYQPRELLSQSLSLPDVHLISLRTELEGLIVPSKYYGIAAAGRPAIFVGDRQGELAKLLEDSATGFAVREGDGAGLARAVLALARDRGLAAAQGRGARQLFEDQYDFPLAVAAWEGALNDVSCGTMSGASFAKRVRAARRVSGIPAPNKAAKQLGKISPAARFSLRVGRLGSSTGSARGKWVFQEKAERHFCD